MGNKLKDSLGDRMKSSYEDRTRFLLPRRSYTIIRLDGKAFHTYTRGCNKPFDFKLIEAFRGAAKILFDQIQGAQFGYLQSDELSILVTDFVTVDTDAWFDGNIQKIVSISSSILTEAFNRLHGKGKAYFDARVFTIPDEIEVENYFIWRQMDWNRNAIQMLARAHFSHKQCEKKNVAMLKEMLLKEKGVNWEDVLPLHSGIRHGYLISNKNIEGIDFLTMRSALKYFIPKRWPEP